MKFETFERGHLSPFELTEDIRLANWSYTGLVNYIQACLSSASQDERYKVLAAAQHGDLFYVYLDTQSNELWTVHVVSNGYVNEVESCPDIRTAMTHFATVIATDLEESL